MTNNQGFSIFDITVSLGIFMLIIVVIIALQISIFKNNKLIDSRAAIDRQSTIVLRNFAKEVRTAQTSHTWNFALASTTDEVLTFYSDLNGDSTVERVRYFVEDGKLKRGIIKPTGQPFEYDLNDETVQTYITNIISSSTYFLYYDDSYDGVITTAPLQQPVTPEDVQLVELFIIVDPGVPDQEDRVLNTKAMIRSLKSS